MVVFLVVALTILFGAHAFVYATIIQFFGVSSSSVRLFLGSALGILSVGFIVSSIIAHYFENFLTRAAYFLTGFWLGVLVNLVLACVLLWLVRFVGQAYLPHALPWLAAVLLGLALGASFYGMWQALHPVVRPVTVYIPGLPEVWRGKTIVQLSDVHLGHVYQAASLRRVVAQVNALRPKAVVITGDLFDGMDGSLDSLVQPFNDMQSENGVYFVTGNHETYLGVEKAFAALAETKVVVLKDEVRDVDGLQIIGIDFPKQGEQKDVVSALTALKEKFIGRPNVLLYHAPTRIAEIAALGVNLMLSGHTHRGQQYPFQLITDWVHHGYDYGLYTLGDFTLYTTSGVGTWGPTLRLGTQSEIVAITLQ